MKRNPAGGAYVELPGGYQEDAGAAFGAGTRPHLHHFVEATLEADGKPLFKGKPRLRCRECYMTKAEAKALPW